MSYGRYNDPKKGATGRPTPPPSLRPPTPPPTQQKPATKQEPPVSSPPPLPASGSARPQRSAPPAGQDEYAVVPPEEYAVRDEPAPARIPVYTPRVREPVIAQDPLPEPPALPFWTGVFSFPFYLQSLGVWMLVAMGLTVGALGIVLCIWCLDNGLSLAFRCFVMPVFLIIAFTCSYASAACMAITQATSEGYDQVHDWPTGDWREWAWTMTYPGGMFVLSALLGWVTHLAIPMWPPIPAIVVVFLAFPILLLSALEAGSSMTPVSTPVLQSLVMVWWGWGIFYVETGLMLIGWSLLVWSSFADFPWLTAAIAAPILAAGFMVYARLMGRLAWYIGHIMDRQLVTDEED